LNRVRLDVFLAALCAGFEATDMAYGYWAFAAAHAVLLTVALFITFRNVERLIA
jgi:hypothetical protein